MAISRLSKVLNDFNKTLNKIEKNYKISCEHVKFLANQNYLFENT